MRTIVFDNEAVQALADPHHRKHRQAIAHVEAIRTDRRRKQPVTGVVPTSVRVEAGWDRTSPRSAVLNRWRLRDDALDAARANQATALRERSGVSVVDAHVAAAATGTAGGPVVIVTSDTGDLRTVAAEPGITVVRI